MKSNNLKYATTEGKIEEFSYVANPEVQHLRRIGILRAQIKYLQPLTNITDEELERIIPTYDESWRVVGFAILEQPNE